MSICLNSSLCFDLGSLVAIKNETGVEQAPFSGYVSPWLAGVIISGLMVLWVLLWTILQSTLRERARRKDQRNKIICESQKLEVQFNETCVQMECLAQNRLEKIVGFSESVDSHVSRLNKANRGEPPMQIEFRQLCLKLMNGRGRTILKNVSGVLFASSLTCIMGPSGCGKTTLLTAIAGRTQNGKISGSIKVNDVEQTIERFRTVVGFVPQDDTMIRTLTVRQILTFSAVARLPRSLSMAEKLDVVDSVIAILGLGRIEHQPIGDENMRGISGGQRKRVNIGIELVSAPLALFLDEPTSGLDACSAYEVISNLHRMKPLNMNIVAVVHQPRTEVFNLFDHMMLLSTGGRTVFSGKREMMFSYFETLGFVFDPTLNPADQILDIVSGAQLPVGVSEKLDLPKLWEDFTSSNVHHVRKPTMDNSSDLVHFQRRMRRSFLEDSGGPELSPWNKAVKRDQADIRVLMAIALVFLAIGLAVCITLLCIRSVFSVFTYENVIIPYCSTGIVIFSAIVLSVIANAFRRFVAMEKLLYLSAGAALGPVGILFGMLWQKRSRYYKYWLFLDLGAGIWVTLVFAGIGTFFAISNATPNQGFSFTTDARVPWMLFMCAPFGFVVVVLSISRIVKGMDSSVRDIATFGLQLWIQFKRCFDEHRAQPSGVLLDFVLAAVSASMIGIVTPTTSRWRTPLLESIALATANTSFPITNCPNVGPPIVCSILSVPQSDPIISNSQFVPLALGLIGVISSLRYFGVNKDNFKRENMEGLSTTAFYVAKSVFAILLSAATSAVFLSFWGFLVQPPAAPGLYFLLIWVTLFSAQGLGFLASITARLDLAGMIGVLVVLIFTLFSTTLSGNGSFQSVISYFSFVGWSSVAFYTTSVQGFNAVLTPWMSNVYGFRPDNMSFAWAQTFCLGVFMRLLAWMSLVLKEN